jgi:O-succinylhomoserine sulfhydrylase
MTHPATTTHSNMTPQERSELGIGDGLIRFSVGIEDVRDLIDDIKQACE